MKRLSFFLIFVITIACSASVYAADAELEQKIKDFYQHHDKLFATKNVDDYFGLYSDQYAPSFGGPGLKQIKEMIGKLFESHDQVRCQCSVDSIEAFDEGYLVIVDAKMEYKDAGQENWSLIEQGTELNILETAGDSFQFKSAGATDKDRLGNFNGKTYTDPLLGVSFDMPDGWKVYPVAMPNMKNAALFLRPGFKYAGLFAFVEVPYNVTPKDAVQGDDAVMKKVATDGFSLVSSGDIQIAGHEGFESITTYKFNEQKVDRKRWRVYFEAGGLLYVNIYEADPSSEWNALKPKFDAVLSSVKLGDESKKSGVSKVRQAMAKGEVTGRIYTNSDLGCQIAAPEGWSLESTTTGDAFLFTVTMKPNKGESVVRFMGVDTKGLIGLDKLVEQQYKSIGKIVDDLNNEPLQDIQLGEHAGKQFVQQFSLEGLGTIKRKTVMYVIDNILYMILCDAKPPEQFAELEPQFNEIIESMTIN